MSIPYGYKVQDWEDAYAIETHIADAVQYYEAWVENSQQFHESVPDSLKNMNIPYGDKPRNYFDLYLPEGACKGLVVFVHGGYWMECEKEFFSYAAAGPRKLGWAVASVGYTLCPDIAIAGIGLEIGQAISKAGELVDGDIALTGHSAGGHLVTRSICNPGVLDAATLERVRRVASISGVHDLRPIRNVEMNNTLGLSAQEARIESPSLLEPATDIDLICWVGGGERAEFVRQSQLLANIWAGLGVHTSVTVEPDRNHFSVLDALNDPNHTLTRALCYSGDSR